MPTAPAMASAIYNAVVVRIRDLPVTAGKIFKSQYMQFWFVVRTSGVRKR